MELRNQSVAKPGLFMAFNSFFHALSGLFVLQWMLSMLAPDGALTGMDIAKATLLTVGVSGAMMIFSALTLYVIPALHSPLRGIMFAVVASFYLAIAIASGWAAAGSIGKRTGAAAHREAVVQQMASDTARLKEAAGAIEERLPSLTACRVAAADMRSREESDGAISLTGGNNGPVTAELAAIEAACGGAEIAFTDARALSSEYLAAMEALVAEARRVVEDVGTDDRAKDKRLLELSEQLATVSTDLANAVPAKLLWQVRASLMKDRRAIKLSAHAVSTIAATMRPIAREIDRNLAAQIESLRKPAAKMQSITNPMAYVASYPGELLSAIAIAILLEMTPILVLAVFIARLGTQSVSGQPTAAQSHDNGQYDVDVLLPTLRRHRAPASFRPTANRKSALRERAKPITARAKRRNT
jgi:hypothetical protein